VPTSEQIAEGTFAVNTVSGGKTASHLIQCNCWPWHRNYHSLTDCIDWIYTMQT